MASDLVYSDLYVKLADMLGSSTGANGEQIKRNKPNQDRATWLVAMWPSSPDC
jgi:hypothetical protein